MRNAFLRLRYLCLFIFFLRFLSTLEASILSVRSVKSWITCGVFANPSAGYNPGTEDSIPVVSYIVVILDVDTGAEKEAGKNPTFHIDE